jgi:hypothetical protein
VLACSHLRRLFRCGDGDIFLGEGECRRGSEVEKSGPVTIITWNNFSLRRAPHHELHLRNTQIFFTRHSTPNNFDSTTTTKVINPSRWLPDQLSPSCPLMALPADRLTLYQRYCQPDPEFDGARNNHELRVKGSLGIGLMGIE